MNDKNKNHKNDKNIILLYYYIIMYNILLN